MSLETVTIESQENIQFKGFFLQARSGDQSIGSFVVPKDGNGKLVNCNQLTQVVNLRTYTWCIFMKTLFSIGTERRHSFVEAPESEGIVRLGPP